MVSGYTQAHSSMRRNRSCRPLAYLLGDSITQFSFSGEHIGWGTLLTEFYEGRRVDVVNRGFSGYNSRWIRQILPTIAPQETLQTSVFATIFLGANDSVAEGQSQHCPLVEFRSNISAIVQHIRCVEPSIVIILITPPPIDHVTWANQKIPGAETGRHSSQVMPYAQTIRDLGAELHADVLDLWQEGPYKIEFEDLCDGLHMGVKGNRKIFEGIVNILQTRHSNLSHMPRYDCMDLHFPDWKELAGKSMEDTQAILDKWEWTPGGSGSNANP